MIGDISFGKDLVVGLSAVFLLWVGAILIASSKLVWSNWEVFLRWRKQDRETRLKMALWLAIPLLMSGLIWMRLIAIWHYAVTKGIPLGTMIQIFVYMPVVLFSLALILWWICDRTFSSPDGDRAWLALVSSGGIIGATATALSYYVF